MKKDRPSADALDALVAVLDRRPRIYRDLAAAVDFATYLDNGARQDDEELLTEGVLQEIIERVLGFPADAYFPQLSKSGLKPDFTPMDLIAHPFVLDAKSSRQRLADHEVQIRTYIDQRHLDFGVLFNLAEFRVYRRSAEGHDPSLSFTLLPLWRLAHGEGQPGPDLEAFERFLALFSHRRVDLGAKIEAIRQAAPWEERSKGDELRVDIDLLVEQLRRLSRLLSEDAENQPETLDTHMKLNPGFEQRLLAELAAIAQDIRPSTDEKSLPSSVAEYRSGGRFEQRVWRQYALRVAQLTLARILLYRAWEDAGFIREQLYDGGFRDVYEELGEKAREVLKSAFAAGAQRYHWLFERQTTYDWYAPREDPLVEVLYSFTQFPLDRLDADVLGGLYESYVDEIDRDRLGQFYTPREVVQLMLDRAGFRGPESVMCIEGDERLPVKTFDFASGSGGFDVEIARRLIDDSGALAGDADLQLDALSAIARGIHALEISPFPYYLTEINLLLQVSRLLGALSHERREVPSFVLSVVHEDALKAKPTAAASLEGLAPEQRADHALLKPDRRFGLVGTLDPEKQAAFDRIRAGGFDLIVGNPPYVAEANNRPLFERLRQIDAWKGTYRGKSDYLYYFLFMAAELLAPGGRLCVIVPAGWMNAGNADWLREKLAATLRLDELFLFGGYRLFAPSEEARTRRRRAPTPTLESAILLATRAEAGKSHKMRVVALEDETLAAEALNGDAEGRPPERAALLAEMARRADGRQGRRAGIHVHDVRQSDLAADRPWPIKHGAKDVGSRVVAHLEAVVADAATVVAPLDERFTIVRGIETGADAYSPRIRKRLQQSNPAALRAVEAASVALGDPILELPRRAERRSPWDRNPGCLAHSIEPSAILYGALDEDEHTSLIWMGRDDSPPAEVLTELEKWRPVLAARAEILRNRSRHWWECAWPRDRELLQRPKVIALYRTDRGRFGIDEQGEWQPSNKTTLVVPRQDDLSVAYLGGLLNSELLDLWYSIRGKAPRDVWRNYEPKRMKEIPYRSVELGAAAGKRPAALRKALGRGEVDGAVALAAEIAADLRGAGKSGLAADAPEAIEAAQALEILVRAIADNRRALLPYRDRFSSLSRAVKDPWSTGPVDPVATAFVDALPKKRRVSVRVDPELDATIETDGVLGKPVYEHGLLTFAYRRKVVARVTGPTPKLMLLAELLADPKKLMPADLLAAEVPRDVDRFKADVEETGTEVASLLNQGRSLVEAAERLVCALYAVPPELENEVVAHAVSRAAASAGAAV